MNDKGRPDERRPLLPSYTLPFFAFASCVTGLDVQKKLLVACIATRVR
jgi:hypothetical protein